MAPPLVSLLIPARDAAETLTHALASVVRQTLTDFECVVVDDGSTDSTRAIVEDFARRDGRFRVLARPHAGLPAALQAGLEACRGRFIARMDADDLMHRERLARQVAALEAAPELSAVGSHVRLFPRSGMSQGLRAYERWLNSISTAHEVRREAFVECPVVHPTLCFRREVLLEHGYRDRGWPEDYDLVLRLLSAGHALGVVPERLLCWRDAPRRYTRTAPQCGQERIVACKAHYLAQGFLADAERYVLWGYGDTGRELRRALLCHGKQPSEIVELHPGRIGQRIHGAPVIHADALARVEGRRVVVSVAGIVARTEIRARLAQLRFAEGCDYVVAA